MPPNEIKEARNTSSGPIRKLGKVAYVADVKEQYMRNFEPALGGIEACEECGSMTNCNQVELHICRTRLLYNLHDDVWRPFRVLTIIK